MLQQQFKETLAPLFPISISRLQWVVAWQLDHPREHERYAVTRTKPISSLQTPAS